MLNSYSSSPGEQAEKKFVESGLIQQIQQHHVAPPAVTTSSQTNDYSAASTKTAHEVRIPRKIRKKAATVPKVTSLSQFASLSGKAVAGMHPTVYPSVAPLMAGSQGTGAAMAVSMQQAILRPPPPFSPSTWQVYSNLIANFLRCLLPKQVKPLELFSVFSENGLLELPSFFSPSPDMWTINDTFISSGSLQIIQASRKFALALSPIFASPLIRQDPMNERVFICVEVLPDYSHPMKMMAGQFESKFYWKTVGLLQSGFTSEIVFSGTIICTLDGPLISSASVIFDVVAFLRQCDLFSAL